MCFFFYTNYLLDSFRFFFHQRWLMVRAWSLSDSMSPQVSRTLLSILTDLNNAIILMVSAWILISKPNYLSLFVFFVFYWVVRQDGNVVELAGSLSLGLVFWPAFGDTFVSQSPWEFHPFHSFGQILVCAYWSYCYLNGEWKWQRFYYRRSDHNFCWIWLGFMVYQTLLSNQCQIFSYKYIYIYIYIYIVYLVQLNRSWE